jgi:nitroreductase
MMKAQIKRRNFLKQGLLAGGAISVLSIDAIGRSLNSDKNISLDNTIEPSNETIKTLQSLRTIHGNFSDKEIPDEQIEQILHSSVRAANASGLQSYSIIVVRDREKMKKICGYRGSCMLLYCVDFNRLKASAESLGYTYYPDSMGNFIPGCISTTVAAQSAVVAAKSLGVDSLITNGVHRGDMQRLWDILELPQTYCFPLLAVVLGYPKEEPAYQKGRLEGVGVIHHDKYHKLTSDEVNELTNKYDDEKLHLGLNDNWEQEGKKHYFDWLFTSWLDNSNPSTTETQIYKFMKRCGFVDLLK